jgi:hypothetical protein
MSKLRQAPLLASPQGLRGIKEDDAAAEATKAALKVRITPRQIAELTVEELLAGLEAIAGSIWSPWAVLLVRFSDDTEPAPSMKIYEDLFTAAGRGKLNMVDFFHDMSHGQVDTSATHLFGWYTLPVKRSDYVGNVYPQPVGKVNRNGLVDLARSAASAAGVNLADFAGVVVSGLGGVDLCGWVGGMAALCDNFSLTPSLLGQEMGHGYGLDHARLQGSTMDYQDPWDVMSTAGYPWMQAPHAEFGTVGPGLNAWNMRSRGWLDESRVWKAPDPAWSETIQLRPLHRTDLPGFLAAEIGPYLVEFRVPERWDAAIPRASILVHRFADNHSYLMPSYAGSQDIVAGDKFMVGDPIVTIFQSYSAEVLNIDAGNRTATVRLQQRPPARVPMTGGTVFGGVEVDGSGGLFVNGHFRPVGPRGPIREMVEQLARYLDAAPSVNGVESALATRRAALVALVRAAATLHAETEIVSEQPPGYAMREQNGNRSNGNR